MRGLTQTEFARRAGCTQATVSNAVRAGRLALLPGGGIDPALLQTRWRINPKLRQKHDDASADGGALTKKIGRPKAKPIEAKTARASAQQAAKIAAATLDKERALARLRYLEYEQRSAAAIPKALVQRVVRELWCEACAAWRAWPANAGPRLARELHIDDAERVSRALAQLTHEHVAQMSEPGADCCT